MFPKKKPLRNKKLFWQYAEQNQQCEGRFLGVPCSFIDPPHHIKYKSEGGGDEHSNLITLCRACHDLVHSDKRKYQKILIDYKKTLAFK